MVRIWNVLDKCCIVDECCAVFVVTVKRVDYFDSRCMQQVKQELGSIAALAPPGEHQGAASAAATSAEQPTLTFHSSVSTPAPGLWAPNPQSHSAPVASHFTRHLASSSTMATPKAPF